jgi:mono/diheme cytochrome c family protein
MLLAASTQRTIGLVILALVFIGAIVYIFFNIRSAKSEIGSEIELAANRRPGTPDEELEGKRLDLALGANLVMLAVIGVSLPVYWLGEPGREEGRNVETDRIFTNRGEDIYIEGAQCISCHGPEGGGGSVSTAITSESGEFVAQVSWKAPALNTVLSRFAEEEVLHTLNFGRNGVMPAWGSGGGGPLTDQQLEEIMFYLRSIQIEESAIRDQVDAGLRQAVEEMLAGDGDGDGGEGDGEAAAGEVDEFLADAQAVAEQARELAIEADGSLAEEANAEDLRWAALEILVSGEGLDPADHELYLEYGGLLFANPGTAGTHSCARCHTFGWSYDAVGPFDLETNGTTEPIIDEYVQGGGFFGPNLTGGSTLAQFETARSHAQFIESGQTIGQTYGRGGSGGNGQMPGFGPRVESDAVGPGVDPNLETPYPATLTSDQIDAVVAFERNL